MKRELKRRFLFENYRQENFTKFYNFKQHNMVVEEYIKEFEYLMLWCDISESEEQTIVRFLGGLKRELVDVIRLQLYWTFNDIRKLAIILEQRLRSSAKTIPKTTFPVQGSGTSSSAKPFVRGASPSKIEPKGEVVPGLKTASNSFNGWRCFKCQGYYHIALECPNRKIITIIEDIDEEEEEVNHEEEKVEEFTELADEGEILVV